MRNAKLYAVVHLGLFLGTTGLAQNQDVIPRSDAAALDAPLIESLEGGALFKAYCATCHGNDAKGSGPMADWLRMKTPDLTQISARAGGKFPLARVQRIISGEETLKAGHGTREMPVWGPAFSQVAGDRDWGRMRVYSLAEFIEALQRKN